jgi:hypothetical protein
MYKIQKVVLQKSFITAMLCIIKLSPKVKHLQDFWHLYFYETNFYFFNVNTLEILKPK